MIEQVNMQYQSMTKGGYVSGLLTVMHTMLK